jgi:Tol biopolymer transport system component
MADLRTLVESEMARAGEPTFELSDLTARRDRGVRRQRAGAFVVAGLVLAAVGVVLWAVLRPKQTEQPAVPPPSFQNGRIVFGEQSRNDSNRLFTMNPDGTDVRDLSVASRCLSWAPDGSKILIGVTDPSTDETVRLATINPDGSKYTELDANGRTQGCGVFSPDGTRIVVGGSTELEPDHYSPREHGIFTVRASDGGDLVRLTSRNGTNPSYSPDGAQIVFVGVQGPGRSACIPSSPPGGGSFTCPPGTYRIGDFDGSVYVMNADGTGLHRIASHMGLLHFTAPSWSPDGRWILFSAGYVVHPDGTGLHRITFETVPRLRGAEYPSWSPDGTHLVFVGWTGADRYNLYTARIDGTDVEQITHTRGIYYRNTDWGTNSD